MGCTSTTAYLTIHNMVSWMLGNWLPTEVAEQWVPKLASGELLGSYCLTEPGAGSDAAALKTRAVREGDNYLVEGTKVFISGAGSTDVLVVMARTGGEGAKGISAFMVPANAPGVSYGKAEEKMGWNSQPTREVVFNGVRIPARYRLGEEGKDSNSPCRPSMGGASISPPARWVPPSRRWMMRWPMCSSASNLVARSANSRACSFAWLTWRRSWLLPVCWCVRPPTSWIAGPPDKSAWCAMAKRFATDVGYRVCDEALQLFGGYGYIREYPLERYLRDTRVHRILEGTNEVMRLIITRRLLSEQGLSLE